MSKFKINQKVYVVENGELKPGIIQTMYDGMGYAVVRYDNDELQKVMFERIAVMPEEKEKEKPSAPVEKSEITITPNEFMEIATSVLAKEAKEMDNPIMFMGACSILMGKIHKALFLEDPNDDKTV